MTLDTTRQKLERPQHLSSCELHKGPASVPGPCSCGAQPGMDPITYGSEFPSEAARENYQKPA